MLSFCLKVNWPYRGEFKPTPVLRLPPLPPLPPGYKPKPKVPKGPSLYRTFIPRDLREAQDTTARCQEVRFSREELLFYDGTDYVPRKIGNALRQLSENAIVPLLKSGERFVAEAWAEDSPVPEFLGSKVTRVYLNLFTIPRQESTTIVEDSGPCVTQWPPPR